MSLAALTCMCTGVYNQSMNNNKRFLTPPKLTKEFSVFELFYKWVQTPGPKDQGNYSTTALQHIYSYGIYIHDTSGSLL